MWVDAGMIEGAASASHRRFTVIARPTQERLKNEISVRMYKSIKMNKDRTCTYEAWQATHETGLPRSGRWRSSGVDNPTPPLRTLI